MQRCVSGLGVGIEKYKDSGFPNNDWIPITIINTFEKIRIKRFLQKVCLVYLKVNMFNNW